MSEMESQEKVTEAEKTEKEFLRSLKETVVELSIKAAVLENILLKNNIITQEQLNEEGAAVIAMVMEATSTKTEESNE